MNILSLVFEDNGDTFCEECLYTVQPRNNPIRVTEYVYKSSSVDKIIVKEIVKSLQDMDYTNQYIEPTHSIQPQIRISKNPPTNESKNYKNMKQNVKRINESQLRAIVVESVKKVLNEISLSNYDNPSIRKGFMDGDEFSTDGVEYNPSVNPEYDDREERWNKLLSMRNRGLLSNEEMDAIRDRFGY